MLYIDQAMTPALRLMVSESSLATVSSSPRAVERRASVPHGLLMPAVIRPGYPGSLETELGQGLEAWLRGQELAVWA